MATTTHIQPANRPIRDPLDLGQQIGEFYVQLMTTLVGGEPNPFQNHNGATSVDLMHWSFDARIEVKGASNNNLAKIWVGQLRNHQEVAGEFFGTRCWYGIFHYSNRRRHKGKARCRIEREVFSTSELWGFLASNTRMLSIIDARVLEAVRQVEGTTPVLHRGKQEHVVRLTRSFLTSFWDNPDFVLKRLGVDTKVFTASRHLVYGTIGKHHHTVSFPVLQVVEPSFHTRIMKAMRKKFLVGRL